MKSIIKTIKSIPVYGWVVGFFCIGFQYGLYLLADLLAGVFGTQQRAFIPKISFIDDRIPVIPAFILIYVFSYLFWIMGNAIASLTERRHFINYLTGLFAAYLIGFMILFLMPTYMDRAAEGLLDHAGKTGFINWLIAFIYRSDGGSRGFNLFPSFHCLSSLSCYLAIHGRKEISSPIRVYTLVMCVLICFSTVFTKQHYFLDVVGGLLISAVCHFTVQKLRRER